MNSFYLGIDVSKGYADFVIINQKKQPMVKNFQLDDTFAGHSRLYEILNQFLADHSNATVFAGMESTGGYENNWYNALVTSQGVLNIQTTRLNPLGVMHNSKADLKRNTTDKISAQNVAEYLIAHPEKVNYQQHDQLAGGRCQGSCHLSRTYAADLKRCCPSACPFRGLSQTSGTGFQLRVCRDHRSG